MSSALPTYSTRTQTIVRVDSADSTDTMTTIQVPETDTESCKAIYTPSRPPSCIISDEIVDSPPSSSTLVTISSDSYIDAALARSRPYEHVHSSSRSTKSTKSCYTITRAVRKQHQQQRSCWDLELDEMPSTVRFPVESESTATRPGHSGDRRRTWPNMIRKRLPSFFGTRAKPKDASSPTTTHPSPLIASTSAEQSAAATSRPIPPRRATISNITRLRRPFHKSTPSTQSQPNPTPTPSAKRVEEAPTPPRPVRRSVSLSEFEIELDERRISQVELDAEIDELTAEATLVTTKISRNWGFREEEVGVAF